MSKEQKRLMAIAGAVLVIALILLMRKGGSQTVIEGDGADVSFGGFSLPGLSMPVRPRTPFEMPSLGGNPLNLSMIGACCSDCSSKKPSGLAWPATNLTFVTNQGNKGPNVFNYYTPAPVAPKATSGVWFSNGPR